MEKKKIIKNVLKIVLILITIFLVLLIVHTIRNYVIITELQDKIAEYNNSINYHIKSFATEKNGTIVKMDYYKKDNKQVVFMERERDSELTKISMYDNGERTDTFTETKESKIAQLNNGKIMPLVISNYLENASKWQTFLGCVSARIKSVEYNEKECYVVKNFMSLTSLSYENTEVYIDKETGLLVKTIESGIENERQYEFNMVEDSIFAEPDISQYKLKENE